MIAAQVGWLASVLALISTAYGAVALGRGSSRREALWLGSGRNALIAASTLLGLALLLLTYAFLGNEFQVKYVAAHSSLELPLYLKLTAVWAGQEGSLLVWSFLQALLAALVVRPLPDRAGPLAGWGGVFLAVIAAFFIGITVFLSNPFALSSLVPGNGAGMSPLLRHPGMIFHPPALYVGYVALAVPFAFALAALITGRWSDWPQAARRWLVVAWLFLGVGIFLGARWAYDVLGWGGYWGWDPVENAALMPWLVSTALLHSLAIQQERGSFRVWNLVLAVLSFLFVLFGTFATRSGLIESVHAFARSNLGYYFLGFMVVVVVVSTYLGRRHRDQLRSSAAPAASMFSREGMFFLTLVVLSAITLSVFVGSILPTLTQALTGNRMEAGPEWFDQVTGPQFGVLVLLLGVCPLAGYSANALRRLGRRLVIPLIGAAVLLAVSALLGYHSLGSLIGFGLVGLAAATTLGEFWSVLARRAAGESALVAFSRALNRNRRRYGGYLVHLGIILMAVGIIGTRMHSSEGQLSLRSGEPRTFGEYTFVYESAAQERRVNHLAVSADFDVYRNGAYLTTLQPQLHDYPAAEQTVAVPALKVGLQEDLYLVLGGVTNDGSGATIRVVVDPLINFLWLGGLVFIAGGVVSLWPSAAKAVGPVAQQRQTLISWASLLLGLAAFALAAYAMWGGNKGVIGRPTGRPLVGEAAPGFYVTTLDGSQLSLADLKGQVALVNFWAGWCQPCEEELPALQAAWEEFGPRGVGFVGLAHQETAASVTATAQEYGLTFPLALDAGDAVAASYGITGIPETFVLDRDGRVAYVHIGPVTQAQLTEELSTLLAQEVVR